MITLEMIKDKLEGFDTKSPFGIKDVDVAFRKITESLTHSQISFLDLNKVWPDEELNCAASWQAFGDYKAKSFDESHEYVVVRPETKFVAWVGNAKVNPEQIAFVWDRTVNTFYKVNVRGSSYNHSENNTEPEVDCFGEEIQQSDIKGYNFEEIVWVIENAAEIDQIIKAHFKAQKIEDAKNYVVHCQEALTKGEAELTELKIKHPRAWKQIEVATKKVDNHKKYLKFAEDQLSRLIAE